MELKKSWIFLAVVFVITAFYTFLVYIPTVSKKIVNTDNVVLVSNDEAISLESNNALKDAWSLHENQDVLMSFELINREYSNYWKGKTIYFKTTYIGKYPEVSSEELDTLLSTDYDWQNQLDDNGNVIIGGPILLKDGRYQLHVHNGLSYSHKQYLLGDLLHYFYANGNLKGTIIEIGGIKLRCVWLKDTHILEDSVAPEGGELILSTCLERNGDRRLLSGWEIIE